MNIFPKEASLYGCCEITAELPDHSVRNDESYYLVFHGTKTRHVTPAAPCFSRNGLHLKGIVPSHPEAEFAEVSAVGVRKHTAARLAAAPFRYVEPPAAPPVHLSESLRAGMGSDPRGAGDPADRLLHFSAKLGLARLARHLLSVPAGQVALCDKLLPEDQNGFHDINQFLHSNPSAVVQSSELIEELSLINKSLVVTSDLAWNCPDLEHDISELETKRLKFITDEREGFSHPTNMKELNVTKNGDVHGDLHRFKGCGVDAPLHVPSRSASLPRNSSILKVQCPRVQTRVLEDNLRRIRNIHEGIQKLRELNTKQIVVHQSSKGGSQRLSHSCPALYLTSGEDASPVPEGTLTMRNIQHRRTSLSSNSRSLDSTFIDSFNVKIHVNDLTPAPSQECLDLASPLSENDCFGSIKLLGNGHSVSRSSNIGGTTSKRLAKKSGKKTPARRQSWSSLGGSAGSPEGDGKHVIQRRWSLSSLDSDTEDAFCKASSSASFRSKSSNHASHCSSLAQSPREKLRNLSDGSCEEALLCHTTAQSCSVPIMHGIAADIKENVEPQKTHSVGSLSSSAKNFLVSFRNHPLQKSLSTPAITVDDGLTDKAKQESLNRQSFCTMHPFPLHDKNSPRLHDPLDCDETSTDLHQQMSLASLLRDGQMHSAAVDSDEEKAFVKRKKRSSIFFKKKPDKHKAKEKKMAHQFLPYIGSSMLCDVCQKSFNKKQALKCENCLVLVHDSTCKDQVVDCNKFKLQRAQSKNSYGTGGKDSSSHTLNGGSSRFPHYPSRYLHLVRPLSQSMIHLANQNKGSLPSSKFGFQLSHTSIPPLGEAASRSSFINLNKMFSEEKDPEGSCELQSNIIDTNSASMESLDEGTLDVSDLEDNQMLRLIDDEPETWNATVDKKVVKKLKERDVKRQEAIYELIITEKHHCLTLQIMQKVFAQGMVKELNFSRETVERFFPCLGDLVELHRHFLCKLRERQKEGQIIENIADVLEDQFHDYKAEQMKYAYGHFCSQHIESLNLYKDMLKSDRKFQNFIKKCKSKRLCKNRGVPECLLLVTQRITKYILVIESLIKSAKDNKEEQQTLEKVLNRLKDIIFQVDVQVAEKEREIKLVEIYNRMDSKATILYRGKKFKKSDLLACNRKLRKEGPMTWRSPRGKTIDVIAVMLSDLILFLHENNQKLCFSTLENKPGIVSLQKLLVRKKAGQDSRGMYLVSSHPTEPEMVELFCRTAKEQKAWMDAVRDAVDRCPAEDEGLPSETEEERKLEAARSARIKQLTSLLQEKDLNFAQLCEERMSILANLLEMVGVEAEQYENVRYSHLVEGAPRQDTKELISFAIDSAARLASQLYASGTNLSRSVSSAGERHSDAYVSPLLPKRAETFGGFDSPVPPVPQKVPIFKRKLLHFKEHNEISILPSKTKIEETHLGESLESALQHFNMQALPSIASKPSSVCSSPDKQSSRKQLLSPSFVQHSSFPPYKEVTTELVNLTATPLLLTQGKDQLVQIVELAHHLNTIVCSVSHLSSAVEGMKVTTALSDEKTGKLARDARDRRAVYRPEHQLEELRNLQKQLNHDRAIWQQEKAQCEVDLKAQREELERLQEQLKVEQSDVTHQRELLYRKLDALQKQGIILSPSHTVVNLNSCGATSRDPDCAKEELHYTMVSPAADSVPDSLHHRRTVSYDLGSSEDQIPYVSSGSSSAAPTHRIDSKNRPALNILPSSAAAGGCKVVPLHLSSSATNMQKRPSVVSVQGIKQQLPLKLSNTFSSSSTNGVGQLPPGANQGPQQVLPMKLALGSLGTSMPAPNSSSLIATTKSAVLPKRSHSAASSPSSTLSTPVHVRGGSSPALVQSTSPPCGSLSPKYPGKSDGGSSILHHLKMAGDKTKNKKDDSNEEIFC